ncbi:MAG: diheme cytochrome c [Casimicrobiaceae bacterium]
MRHSWLLSLAAILFLAQSGDALAGRDREMPPDVPPLYYEECGACHTAYPPSLLPSSSWRRIMGGLTSHYGVDAALDGPDATQELQTWLLRHAGTYKRVTEAPAEDRITRSAWFERKHRKIDAEVWRLPSVKTPANCDACHTDTREGRFSDHALRVPEGLSLLQRRAWFKLK